jgi:D-alanyl-D-alanine carboxypeptidase (penicillin-binding protein 5/6)
MKKLISFILASSFCALTGSLCGFKVENTSSDPKVLGCKSAYLMDFNSQECIYKENETKRMPIASVCKVMTATLCFEAIDSGKLSLDESITVSENSASMGGSQIFLASGNTYTVDQLLKSVIVCSANDSCVALAERVGGSEESFVALMNKRAEELGCFDTLFANCTGLPKETQYSCAKDVATMFANLLKYDGYFNYSKVWLEDFVHPDMRTTCMTNTNKLIKKYSYCDGGKTGFTNEAGFCLASTAKKDNLRLVSVVLGGDTSDNRFSSAINLFNFGFANYKNKLVLDSEVALNEDFEVKGGKSSTVSVCPERNSYVFSAIDKSPDVTYKVTSYNLKAPIAKGQIIGKIEVFKDGILCDTLNLLSFEEVKKATYGDYFKNVANDWAL